MVCHSWYIIFFSIISYCEVLNIAIFVCVPLGIVRIQCGRSLLNIRDMTMDGTVTMSCLTVATPWTVVCQAPLSMGFSRQGYWSGLPFLFPGDLPSPGIKPSLLHCRQILYQLNYEGSPWHMDGWHIIPVFQDPGSSSLMSRHWQYGVIC